MFGVRVKWNDEACGCTPECRVHHRWKDLVWGLGMSDRQTRMSRRELTMSERGD